MQQIKMKPDYTAALVQLHAIDLVYASSPAASDDVDNVNMNYGTFFLKHYDTIKTALKISECLIKEPSLYMIDAGSEATGHAFKKGHEADCAVVWEMMLNKMMEDIKNA